MGLLVIILINLIGSGLVFKIEQAHGNQRDNKKNIFMGQWPYNLVLLLGILFGSITGSVVGLLCVGFATVGFYVYATLKSCKQVK